ncbi:MAG: hypothetical protein EXR73_00395 [Myxococcales bacterium]|nr:hypothetical protein [Myxococcales bacterium]
MRLFGPMLLCLVVGVAVGAGFTKLLSLTPVALQRSSGSDRVAHAEQKNLSAAAADVPSLPSLPAPVEAERVVLPSVVSAPSSVIEDATRAARTAPLPSRVRGDRKVNGRVARSDGSGVSGVVVRARLLDTRGREPGPPRLGLAAPLSDSLDRAIQRAVESWYEQAGRRVETTTDGDGRYELAELPAGRWSLEPWSEGFAIEVPGGGSTEVEPDATLDFVATPVERVSITVLLPNGDPPARAAIQLRSGQSGGAGLTLLWTDATREIAVKPGGYEARATLGDPEQGPAWSEVLASDWTTIEVEEGVIPARLRLTLKGAPGLRGRIVFPTGAKRGNVMVRIAPAPANTPPDLVALTNDHSAPTSWASQGTYLFRDLAPGCYVVGVARNWGERIVAHAVVDVKDAMVVQDLAIPAADPSTSLVVKVLDADGALVEECDFHLEVGNAEGRSTGTTASAERKANGNWWVSLAVVNDVDLATPWPDGTTVKLTVSTSRFGSKSVDIAPGTRALQVRFGAPAKLLATIEGYAGSGYEGRLQLTLDPVGSDDGAFAPRSLNGRQGVAADGTQTFGPIEAGAWRLKLQLQQKQAWQRRTLATVEVALVPGDNRAAIAIPTISDLVVSAPGRSGTIQLQNVVTKETEHESLDAEGSVTFAGLPAGDYTLQTFGGVFELMRVRVPCAGVLRFEPMTVNAALVTITDRAGTLEAIGFRDGDLIVGIDGNEFESSMQMQIILMQSIAKAKVTFTLLRGNQRVELDVNPKDLMNPQKQGGSIEPTSR